MKKPAQKDARTEERADLYLFHGDEFLVKERVQDLVTNALDPKLRETNLVILDGSSLDVSDLSSQLFTPSLFGGARVVVVDQCTLFMGRTDQRKILAKLVDAWQSRDRKASFRALGQLLSVAGIGLEELKQGPQALAEILDESSTGREREILTAAAAEFLEQGTWTGAKNDEGAVEELILSPFPPGTVLLFTATDVDKRKKIFKAVEKRGRVVECAAREEKYRASLDRPFFEERVQAALARNGKTITPKALNTMYGRAGKNLRRLHSELDKLVGYLGPRTEVTEEDVAAVFSDFHEAAFFDLTNALRTGDIAKCLPALHENLKIVAHPLQTITAMANDIRRLIAARELLFTVFRLTWKSGMSFASFTPILKAARENYPERMKKGKYQLLTMNDYALYSTLRDAQKFSMETLVRGIEALLQADIMMKSTRLGAHAPEAIIEEVLFSLCNARQSREPRKDVTGKRPVQR